MGISTLARRAAGFADNNMHAEVVNGMDVLAVRDAVLRAREGCLKGQGPYLVEVDTYRYYGHSLSDPRVEYRTKEEEETWKKRSPVENFRVKLEGAYGVAESAIQAVEAEVEAELTAAVKFADESPEPSPDGVLDDVFAPTEAVRQARGAEA